MHWIIRENPSLVMRRRYSIDCQNVVKYISEQHITFTMTDNSDLKFCVHCGAELDSGAMFCRSCGAQVETAETQQAVADQYASARESSMNTRLTIIGIFCVFYAVMMIICGIYLLAFGDSLMNKIVSDPNWPDVAQAIIDAGKASTVAGAEQWMRDSLKYPGFLSLFIGIVSAFPAYSCFTKKAYLLGLVTLVISTIISALTIIGLIIGIIFVIFYCTCKPVFEKQTA